MTFYAPRLPADPLARSKCIRSFICSLRALQAPCLGTTLGGTPPPDASPSGRLFRVGGYAEGMLNQSGISEISQTHLQVFQDLVSPEADGMLIEKSGSDSRTR